MLFQPSQEPSEIRMFTVSVFRNRGAEGLGQARAISCESFSLVY